MPQDWPCLHWSCIFYVIIPGDIRILKDRICCFHFKDGDSYLGAGKIPMKAVAESIRAIQYRGWIVLETACPTKNPEADYKRNVQYVHTLMT
jgi:L-ribulose-5-phosphate 3-epimerase